MEILFAVVWSAEFSLCNRFAISSRVSQIYVLKGVSITFCGLAFFVLMHIALLVIFQGNEQETLNILRRIYRINNPKSKVEYNVTKVVEDLEFIDNEPGEITNVSQNPFVQFYKQTCLLFSRKYVAKTVLICLIQVHVECSLNRKTHLHRSDCSVDCSDRAMDFTCSSPKSSTKSRCSRTRCPAVAQRSARCCWLRMNGRLMRQSMPKHWRKLKRVANQSSSQHLDTQSSWRCCTW